MRYSQSIKWGNQTLTVESDSLKRARLHVLMIAKDAGYTVPKWWQFWRKNDTNVLDWRKI